MVKTICYGLVYLVEAMIVWSYFRYIFESRRNRWIILSSFLLAYAALFAIHFLGSSGLNTFCFFLANAFLGWFNVSCTKRAAILHSALLAFIMHITELIILMALNLFGYEFDAYRYNDMVLIALCAASKLLFMVFSVICARVFGRQHSRQEDIKMTAVLCLLPLISMVVTVMIVYIGSAIELTDTGRLLLTVNVISMLVVNIAFLLLYNHLLNANARQVSLQLKLQKEEADAIHYQQLQAQADAQRMFIHDIKNHLQTIQSLAGEADAHVVSDYICKLEKSLPEMERVRLCADPILNVLLQRYQFDCNAHDVEFTCDVREGTTGFMTAPDITTLYGNLLSNALEAAQVSREKHVELSVIRMEWQGILMISVINSCDQAPESDGAGYYLTRKADKHLHGVGLKSVQRTVEKYQGLSKMWHDSATCRFHYVIQFAVTEK